MQDEHLTAKDLAGILSLDEQACSRLLFHHLAVCPHCYAVGGYLLDLYREGLIDLAFDTIGISLAVSRKQAPRLLEELRAVPAGRQQTCVRREQRFRSWGLCELLCRESEREASRDPEGAVALARLAVDIASVLDQEEQEAADWLDLLRAYALAHLGHACRALGDVPAAETAFSSALDLWTPAFNDLGDVLGYAESFLALLTCLKNGMVSIPTSEGAVKGGVMP
jgi:hypothetical protein